LSFLAPPLFRFFLSEFFRPNDRGSTCLDLPLRDHGSVFFPISVVSNSAFHATVPPPLLLLPPCFTAHSQMHTDDVRPIPPFLSCVVIPAPSAFAFVDESSPRIHAWLRQLYLLFPLRLFSKPASFLFPFHFHYFPFLLLFVFDLYSGSYLTPFSLQASLGSMQFWARLEEQLRLRACLHYFPYNVCPRYQTPASFSPSDCLHTPQGFPFGFCSLLYIDHMIDDSVLFSSPPLLLFVHPPHPQDRIASRHLLCGAL